MRNINLRNEVIQNNRNETKPQPPDTPRRPYSSCAAPLTEETVPRGPGLGLPCPSHRGLWGGRFRLAGAPLSETPCGQTRTQSRVPGRGAGAVGRGRPFQNFLVVGAGRGFSGSLGLSREISEQVHVTAPPAPPPQHVGGGTTSRMWYVRGTARAEGGDVKLCAPSGSCF